MDPIRVFAGECTTRFEGTRERTLRGDVVVLVKPDKTVLVHDADGYQPVAWLTRADAVTIECEPTVGSGEIAGSGEVAPTDDDADCGAAAATDDDAASGNVGAVDGTDGGFGITARTDDQVLRVVSHTVAGRADFPASEAGVPVGRCPDCGGALVRTNGTVACLGCEARYPLAVGATVLDERCGDCGLPLMRAERGAAFEVCVDRSCESLDAAVRERFDRAWTCPECGDDLRVRRRGSRLLAGCDAYPDCETAFSIPAGVVVDDCDCGLPTFATARGRRCLDATCDRPE